MEYRVSVIIPVYNCEKFLRRAVDSVVNQPDFNSIQLILVDDGSTDGSPKICDEYCNRFGNVTVIHQNNAGVSVARNAGLDAAYGEWIAFLDSDDYFTECAFERMLKYKDSDIICAKHISNCALEENFDSFFEDGIYDKSEVEITLNKILASRRIFYPCWARLYKKRIIRNNNLCFPEGIKIAEDMMFVYSYLLYAEKLAFTKEEVYFYFVNENNTTNIIPKSFDVLLKNYQWLNTYFSENVCNNDEMVLKNLRSSFVFRSFDSIKIAANFLSFFDAQKYISEILNNDTFYELYLNEHYTNFKSITDKILNKCIIKKNSFIITIVMYINKIKTRLLNK